MYMRKPAASLASCLTGCRLSKVVACHNGSVRRAGMAIGRHTQHRHKTHTTMVRSCILIIIRLRGMDGRGWGGLGMGCQMVSL